MTSPARSRSPRALVTLVVAALVALLAPLAGPAYAAPSPQGAERATGWYLALGDSLAAGYQPGRTPREDYTGGYVGQVLEAVREESPKTRLVNLACSGATSSSMLSGDAPCNRTYEEGTQFAQAMAFLHAHGRHTRLVTLTVGANDVTPCLQQADPTACATTRLGTYAANLATMVGAIRAAAPDAEVVVTNYYNPFLALWLDPARRPLVPLTTVLQRTLNGTIAQVAAGRADVADVAAAFSSYDATPTVTPLGTLPTNVAVVCAWTWMCSPFTDIHARDAGYAAIARAVEDQL